MRIALIGMMGCMKTSTGLELEKLANLQLFDTDEIFVNNYKMSISSAFNEYGERFFRDKETEILESLVGNENCIIACGGGIVLAERNREFLSSCKVVHLYASSAEIFRRLQGDTSRPLLNDMSSARIESIYATRKEIYKGLSDIEINTESKVPSEIALEIMKKI